MASIQKRGDMYVVQTCINRVRRTRSFPTFAHAKAWGAEQESEALAVSTGNIPNKTVAELFHRYRDEVSNQKRGAKWEYNRLTAMSDTWLGKVRLPRLNSTQMAQYRDERLKVVKGSTVRRELTLVKTAFNTARREWRWLTSNPLEGVKSPANSRPRTRLYNADEIKQLTEAAKIQDLPDGELGIAQRAGYAFLFALETGMRSGEIAKQKRSKVFAKHLRTEPAKNGDERDVPLSLKSREILAKVGEHEAEEIFGLTPSQIDSNFRKLKKQVGIEHATFHDSRHNACTRLSDLLQPLELARMIGHKDLNQLLVYYNKSAADIADKL